MPDLNVLVLGVGGNVSQGILKALALSSLRCRVVGACVNPTAMGLHTVDRAYISPPARDSVFVPWLVKVCRDEGIHAVLSGVEPVLDVLACHAEALRQGTGAISIVSDPAKLAIAGDKLRTCEWLRDRRLGFPLFADSEDRIACRDLAHRVGYPLLLKPRTGKGAHGITMIRSDSELEALCPRPGYVTQEYLGSDEEEYTAGCFSDAAGKVRGCIVMKRELLEGTTVRAEAGAFPAVRQEALRIADALKPLGPCNVQMRLVGQRAICFEINLRFSGTTPMRARLGFNDVEAALRHYVLHETARDLQPVESGIVSRYWNEVYLNPTSVEALRRTGRLDDPAAGRPFVEDYGIRA